MNIGFFAVHCMAFAAAHNTGMKRSIKFSFFIGLTPSLEDLCLFTSFVQDPNDPDGHVSDKPLSLGLSVDDFVYFLEDQDVKKLFCRLLSKCCNVDFMGIVEWFLGVHFSWCISSSLVSVYLNQSSFASNLVESFFCKTREASPLAIPYCSGIPVDSIAPSTDEADSPAETRWMQAYQSLIGSIGWLAMTTCPDLTAIHFFLSSYSAKSAVGHMKSALYALHYIHSTFDYGISFTSKDMAPIHSYIHYPPSTDVEAYTDAIPPKIVYGSNYHRLQQRLLGFSNRKRSETVLCPIYGV